MMKNDQRKLNKSEEKLSFYVPNVLYFQITLFPIYLPLTFYEENL